MKISVCVIALNEESNLPRCLRSLNSVADEIILVDSGSTDKTCEVARSFGAQVFNHQWDGYVGQKNYAISLARYEWILFLDADEELSPSLKDHILFFKKMPTINDKVNGFMFPRVVYYKDRWIRFGDWYPDYLVRLFRKGSAEYQGGSVHERLHITGKIIKVNHEIYHYTYKDEQDHMERIEKYSTLWAESSFLSGKKCSAWSPYVRAAWKLFRGMVIKSGWKGGLLGWQIAKATAYEVKLKYQKLHRLQNGSVLKKDNTPRSPIYPSHS